MPTLFFDDALTITSGVLCFGLGLVVIYRERSSFVHRIFALGMAALVLEQVLGRAGRGSITPESALGWQYFSLIVTALLPGIWLSFSCRFGRENIELKRFWRWIPLPVFLIPIFVLFLGGSLFKGLPEYHVQAGWYFRLGWPGELFQFSFLLGIVLVLVNLEKTFRISVGRVRWQIKYLLLGLGGFFIFRVYLSSQAILFSMIDSRLEILNGGALLVAALLCCVALFRTRLLHFDLYFSPALLHRSLTLVLVSVYLIGVALVAELSAYFRWVTEIPVYSLVVLIGLLTAAALVMSERFHLAIKRFVSRYFGRPQHDYRDLWNRFTEQTTSVLEEDELARRTAAFVSASLESPSVSVWLADERRKELVFAASTGLNGAEASKSNEDERISRLICSAMIDRAGVVDSEHSSPDWISVLNELDPDYLTRNRVRYFVPLEVRGEFFGVMTLSDRVKRKGHSFEELELMRLLGQQTAASLSNLRLSAQVQHVKQVEAFQHMSAFLLHDLKNLAQRFALTAGNLATNFDDSEYRKHAISVLDENVEKIRSMCNDLALLRKRIELERHDIDLNELVQQAIQKLKESTQSALVDELHPLPPVYADAAQMRKVLANLVLNADEASDEGNRIQISTEHLNGSAIVSVTDSGCGMSEDFVRDRLFQPFQTTKKKGMGIGLYHSKMIVDLHGGKLEVESVPGKGTTFRVVLPIRQ